MNIALLGYGKMGKEIEKIALERGHTICVKIDVDNQHDFDSPAFKKADAAIDFSIPSSAYANIIKCFDHNVPVVCGTTGWLDKYEQVVTLCKEKHQAFFYASNYSVGMNVLFAVNKYLAKVMDRFSEYDVRISETHHTQKLDAPSGTAISLAKDIVDSLGRKKQWVLEPVAQKKQEDLPIEAIRRDAVPGIHDIMYESSADIITISHSAKSRRGLALGAVVAAEFIKGKKGIFSMNDVLGI